MNGRGSWEVPADSVSRSGEFQQQQQQQEERRRSTSSAEEGRRTAQLAAFGASIKGPPKVLQFQHPDYQQQHQQLRQLDENSRSRKRARPEFSAGFDAALTFAQAGSSPAQRFQLPQHHQQVIGERGMSDGLDFWASKAQNQVAQAKAHAHAQAQAIQAQVQAQGHHGQLLPTWGDVAMVQRAAMQRAGITPFPFAGMPPLGTTQTGWSHQPYSFPNGPEAYLVAATAASQQGNPISQATNRTNHGFSTTPRGKQDGLASSSQQQQQQNRNQQMQNWEMWNLLASSQETSSNGFGSGNANGDAQYAQASNSLLHQQVQNQQQHAAILKQNSRSQAKKRIAEETEVDHQDERAVRPSINLVETSSSRVPSVVIPSPQELGDSGSNVSVKDATWFLDALENYHLSFLTSAETQLLENSGLRARPKHRNAILFQDDCRFIIQQVNSVLVFDEESFNRSRAKDSRVFLLHSAALEVILAYKQSLMHAPAKSCIWSALMYRVAHFLQRSGFAGIRIEEHVQGVQHKEATLFVQDYHISRSNFTKLCRALLRKHIKQVETLRHTQQIHDQREARVQIQQAQQAQAASYQNLS